MTKPPCSDGSGVRPVRTRTDVAVSWVVWHAGELAAAGVPLLLAVTTSWWWLLVAVVAGVAWVGHEYRTRARRDELESVPQRELAAGEQSTTDEPDEDNKDDDEQQYPSQTREKTRGEVSA